MTREEIIEAIQHDNMMPFLQDWEVRDVVDFVLKNIQPSLPEGLDEAALFGGLNYVDTIPDGGTKAHPWNDEDIEKAYQEGMKAGAEWQKAKMMEKAVEGEVIGYDDGTGKFITVLEDLPDNSPYKVHDKVKLIVIPEEK